MSGHASTRAVKNTVAVASVLLASTVLAGCSTLGTPFGVFNGPGAGDRLVTGAIGTSGQGDLSQPMPGELAPVQGSSGPYLPPANVGVGANPVLVTATARPVTPQATVSPNNSTSVTARSVPVVPSSSNVGVQQAMPAQTSVTPLFQDSSAPQAAASQPAPQLSVVDQNRFRHTIEAGESLYAIARRYDVSVEAIVEANNLSSPDQIAVGQQLIIPGRPDLLAARSRQTGNSSALEKDETAASDATQAAVAVQVASAQPGTPAMSGAGNYRWPVSGRVIVDFEASRRTGINIEAPDGAPVRSAENGTVIYVGDGVAGYGNLILVRHPNGFISAYAHLKSISVAKDDVVSRGQQIGTVGTTGSVTRPQLHFELRQGATPLDPMPLLAS